MKTIWMLTKTDFFLGCKSIIQEKKFKQKVRVEGKTAPIKIKIYDNYFANFEKL